MTDVMSIQWYDNDNGQSINKWKKPTILDIVWETRLFCHYDHTKGDITTITTTFTPSQTICKYITWLQIFCYIVLIKKLFFVEEFLKCQFTCNFLRYIVCSTPESEINGFSFNWPLIGFTWLNSSLLLWTTDVQTPQCTKRGQGRAMTCSRICCESNSQWERSDHL